MNIRTLLINASLVGTLSITTQPAGAAPVVTKKVPKELVDLTDADGLVLTDADGETLQTKERITA